MCLPVGFFAIFLFRVTESLFDRGRPCFLNSRRNPENAQLLLGMRRKPKLRFRNQAIRVQELRPNLHPARPSTGTREDAPEPGDGRRGEETPPERLSQMVAQLRQEDKVGRVFPRVDFSSLPINPSLRVYSVRGS